MSRSPGTYQKEGTIPQALLPLIADGATRISDVISVVRDNGRWTYFCGVQPVFQHAENDRRWFQMFTAQLICQGVCRHVDIMRAFGVSKSSVIRSVNTYRAGGVNAFYTPRATRGASVMTPEVTAQAQQLLGAGESPREVAEQLGIKLDTLRKAIRHGRLTVPLRAQPAEPTPEETPAPQPPVATDKSTRAAQDAAAEMGTACTRPDERALAAFGLLDGAPTRFETCRDVSFGGVLRLAGPGGQWPVSARPRLPGKVTRLLQHAARDCPVGPHGALSHQDRRAVAVPAAGRAGQAVGTGPRSGGPLSAAEAGRLSIDEGPQKWAGLLARDWLKAEPELAGALYVDGHVRLYHGELTALPKRYVSRQRLCLRGTTDYWVNDALGRPFFVVERTIDHGLPEVLRAISCRVCSRMSLASRPRPNSRPTAIVRGS